MTGLLAWAAGGVSALFAAFTLEQFLRRKRPQQLAWALALCMFAIASLAAARGITGGWSPGLYRIYYLLGAVINVPVLAAGTVYLLASRRAGHGFAASCALASVWAAVAVFSAEVDPQRLSVRGTVPPAGGVMPADVRALSRLLSFAGAFVVFVGAGWSAWRLSKKPGEHLRRVAQGNVAIALGTAVVAAAGVFARHGRGLIFMAGLLGGVCCMFAGFLRTRPPRASGG